VKVLLVNFADGGGGAARAAYRLHRALLAAGVESRMKVRWKLGADSAVLGPAGPLARLREGIRIGVGAALQRLQRSTDAMVRSANLLPSGWAREIDQSDADVVHLHWLGQDTMSIEDIGRLRKPVVWTLHDMWAFCGAEHYGDTRPAARWREGYRASNRPPGHAGLDLDRLAWQRKRNAWRRRLFLAAPTAWLKECAASSALLSSWPCRVIPNALDTARFAPADRAAARRALGLPESGPVVLFGGSGSDPIKGYDLLVLALEELARLGGPRPHCAAFGAAPRRDFASGRYPIHWLGRIEDDAQLARLYSAGDAMVVPSRLDNLPQTATEAQACGCPVVGFSVGGMADAVEHGATGFLAPPLEPAELARGIAWVLEQGGRDLRERARERAVRLWSPGAVVPKYLALYEQAIAACRLP